MTDEQLERFARLLAREIVREWSGLAESAHRAGGQSRAWSELDRAMARAALAQITGDGSTR